LVMQLPPLTPLRRFDTHRLLPAKYSSHFDSVLTRLIDPSQSAENAQEDLQRIFELDKATNSRLLAEDGRSLGITPRELVVNVPQAHIINAAFTHPNPLGARFSSPERGAWYAAFELSTSKAEVLFHKTIEYAEIDWKEREEVIYDDYLADFTATFHDIRDAAARSLLQPTHDSQARQESLARQWRDTGEFTSDITGTPKVQHISAATDDLITEEISGNPFAASLSPTTYVDSELLAADLLAAGSLGLIYPSVRKPGGTCIACFRPSVVSNVRKGARYNLIWTPTRATMTRC
jgi:hypothetical protein